MDPSEAVAAEGENTDTEDGALEAIQTLQGMLEVLVPRETIDLTDIYDEVYTVKTKISAKAQIIVMREMQSVWASSPEGGGISGFTEQSIMGAIMNIGASGGLLDSIENSVSAAYPQLTREAARRAIKAEVEVPDNPSPGDFFTLEEMVRSLVPFFGNFLAKMAQILKESTAKAE